MNCACKEERGALVEPCGFHGKWLDYALHKLREVAHEAVSHVGMANYHERQAEAHKWIDEGKK